MYDLQQREIFCIIDTNRVPVYKSIIATLCSVANGSRLERKQIYYISMFNLNIDGTFTALIDYFNIKVLYPELSTSEMSEVETPAHCEPSKSVYVELLKEFILRTEDSVSDNTLLRIVSVGDNLHCSANLKKGLLKVVFETMRCLGQTETSASCKSFLQQLSC